MPRARTFLPALLAVVATLGVPAAARAANVWVETEHHYLVVQGGGQADNLTVSPGPFAGTYAIVAAGGSLTAGSSQCVQLSATTARCGGTIAGVFMSGDKGSDTLTLGVSTTAPSYLVGGDGNDVLRGGPGADWLFGDAGNDRLVARDTVADQIGCGVGADTVVADDLDQPPADCEVVERPLATAPGAGPAPVQPAPVPAPAPAPVAPAPVRIADGPARMSSSGVVPLRMRCPATESHACRGRITIRLAGAQASAAGHPRIIGRARFRIRPGRKASVRVLLSRNGRQRILRRRRARCSVVARTGTQVRKLSLVVTAPRRER